MNYLLITVTGLILGGLASTLVHFGNPGNMGYCIACFLRDIAGSLGLHRAAAVQYLRPEIIGLVLGGFVTALATKEWRPRGGSSPIVRFVLGMVFMVGALLFLGCPVRMFLRIAGGDLNALVALPGLVLGIGVGTLFIKKGFSLGRSAAVNPIGGAVMPAFVIGLLVLLLTAPAFILRSSAGPGSLAAPVLLSLGAGLIVGGLAQRSRFCTIGGFRDLLFIKDSYLIRGTIGLLIGAFALNLVFGLLKPGFVGQPVAHTDGLWNFLGMAIAGMAAVLLGGCPLRQLILSAEGDTDAGVTIFGMLAGAALAHNFGLASSATGPTLNGKWAGAVVIALLLVIGWFGTVAATKRTAAVLAPAAGAEAPVAGK